MVICQLVRPTLPPPSPLGGARKHALLRRHARPPEPGYVPHVTFCPTNG